MTRVAILWHMHQPFYEDLATREHIMPWVRLHALKDYYGMVALLREFPQVRMTFNLVPSLLVQLEAFAEDRARDRSLELSLKPAVDLDEQDVSFVLENFFHRPAAAHDRPYPRYGELLARRGDSFTTIAERRGAAARFSADDLRDLQVWHKLAWIDPFYLDRDDRIRGLVAKGRGFSEGDKLILREVELELLKKVIPEYRAAAERGQIEISASPFYHPILPLLVRQRHLPSHAPRRPSSAAAVSPAGRRRRAARSRGGLPRTSVWSAAGRSLAVRGVGVGRHCAARRGRRVSMDGDRRNDSGPHAGVNFSRDARGFVEQPDQLYVPYLFAPGDRRWPACFGTTCCPTESASSIRAGRQSRRRKTSSAAWSSPDAAMPNAPAGERRSSRSSWTAKTRGNIFAGGGRPFLRALYRRLDAEPELRTVTMAEACAETKRELTGIFPGSWIDANFYIWIGHADDQKGWSQLADARAALDAAAANPGPMRPPWPRRGKRS
jgi:Alpha-amylase/alpha-mannosidase